MKIECSQISYRHLPKEVIDLAELIVVDGQVLKDKQSISQIPVVEDNQNPIVLRRQRDRLHKLLENVLPYTEAERLHEESQIRLGLGRAPIRYAVNEAKKALEEIKIED